MIERKKTVVISPENRNYPYKLKESLSDCKPIHYRGELSICNSKSVAVVGSRNCTEYGIVVAKEIGKKAAEYGAVVISGLARGIDTASHRGALSAGAKTVAVLGGGINTYYPKENKILQDKIGEEGLLISEYEDDFQAKAYTFPQRNRIISALADAVVVVEAQTRSGSLITAESAIEQGKNVYAVPGNITSKTSMGTNKLIREGALPLVFIDDVFIDMGLTREISKESEMKLGKEEKAVLEIVMKAGEISFEQLYHITNIKPQKINGIISVLELKGFVFSEMGKILIAKF